MTSDLASAACASSIQQSTATRNLISCSSPDGLGGAKNFLQLDLEIVGNGLLLLQRRPQGNGPLFHLFQRTIVVDWFDCVDAGAAEICKVDAAVHPVQRWVRAAATVDAAQVIVVYHADPSHSRRKIRERDSFTHRSFPSIILPYSFVGQPRKRNS